MPSYSLTDEGHKRLLTMRVFPVGVRDFSRFTSLTSLRTVTIGFRNSAAKLAEVIGERGVWL